MLKGIDVSEHNGKLNWNSLKSHIDFAFIRIGYGGDSSSQDDAYAKENMKECERLGIPYGVYIYSYALNKTSVLSEAKHVLRVIKGHTPKLGIYFDMEDADSYKVKHNFNPTTHKTQLLEFCNVFMDEIRKSGYKIVGTYASSDYFKNIIPANKINGRKWLAQWFKNDGPKDCKESWATVWQYSEDGHISGFNCKFDMNYYVDEKDFKELTKLKESTSHKTTSKKKSYETIAKEVIEGKWGNGDTRIKKLKEAKYDYEKVQKIVNKLLS